MTRPIDFYRMSIDTHNRKFKLSVWSKSKKVDDIPVDDPEMFVAIVDMCRNEKPLSYDEKTMIISTTEHEPIGEGEEPVPVTEPSPSVESMLGKDHPEPSVRLRPVNQYRSEINIKDRQFTVWLYLDENLRGSVQMECPRLYMVLQEMLRIYGRSMVWDHYAGVLSSGVLRVGSGCELPSERTAA